DADDIAVQNGSRLIEGDAANGAGGVTPNPWQGQHLLEALRKLASIFAHNYLGGPLHIPHARVISQPFPQLVNFFLLRSGETSNGWERLHPTAPVGQDGLDLGLLEHDFGYKYSVGICGPSPGQVTGVLGIPVR